MDELVVLDLESDDGSAELARRAGARVVAHPAVPIVELVRNDAADAATGDWVLVVDPDERVSPGLAGELRRLAARDDIDAVVLPRMNLDFGHAPSSPLQRYEPQLRMYRRAAVCHTRACGCRSSTFASFALSQFSGLRFFARRSLALGTRLWFRVVAKQNRHMTKVSLLTIGASLWSRTHASTVLGRSAIYEGRLYPQIIRID